MRNTLICTVGSSFLSNVKYKPDDHPIKQAIIQQNWQELILFLLNLDPTDRDCGAEVNSIYSICTKNILEDKFRLVFFVSDTPDGHLIGDILQRYYQNSKNPIKFETVETKVLIGLTDENIKSFQQQGLKNLVIEISTLARNFSPETLVINATGGYKAQISFAGMIGQALSIPVYYLFEKFSEVIELPPQPVSLDLGLWLENYDLFNDLEESDVIQADELPNDSISLMLDAEPENSGYWITLSAMGKLFHERCRFQFAKQETAILSLIPCNPASPESKSISIRDDHGKDILQKFAKKICNSPYVIEVVNSLPFNPKRTNPIRKVDANGLMEFVLTWTDPGFGLCIQTTGRNRKETTSIALHLAKNYGR